MDKIQEDNVIKTDPEDNDSERSEQIKHSLSAEEQDKNETEHEHVESVDLEVKVEDEVDNLDEEEQEQTEIVERADEEDKAKVEVESLDDALWDKCPKEIFATLYKEYTRPLDMKAVVRKVGIFKHLFLWFLVLVK